MLQGKSSKKTLVSPRSLFPKSILEPVKTAGVPSDTMLPFRISKFETRTVTQVLNFKVMTRVLEHFSAFLNRSSFRAFDSFMYTRKLCDLGALLTPVYSSEFSLCELEEEHHLRSDPSLSPPLTVTST